MGILSRLFNVGKAWANHGTEKLEDPEVMVKQIVLEMREGQIKATAALAQAMANEKRMEAQAINFKRLAEDMQGKAVKALQGGNEELAKAALAKKAQLDQQYVQYQQMFESAHATTSQLKEQVAQLKAKLDEAQMKESMLIARSQNAQAQADVAKKIGGLGNNSFTDFGRMEEKIMKKEAEAQAFTQLANDSTSIDDELRKLEKNTQVEDEFAKLKASLAGGSVNAIGTGSAANPALGTGAATSAADDELAKLKAQLGQS